MIRVELKKFQIKIKSIAINLIMNALKHPTFAVSPLSLDDILHQGSSHPRSEEDFNGKYILKHILRFFFYFILKVIHKEMVTYVKQNRC